MDHNKRRTNKKTKRTTETRTNSNELKSEEDVEQSPANPHSLGFEIKHPYLLGHQFNNWKKGLSEEAGQSPLKPLVNEVKKRKKLADKKIDMVDNLLQQMSDAEKGYTSSIDDFLKKIETSSDDMESLTTSLDLFMENSSELLEVFENARDFLEKP